MSVRFGIGIDVHAFAAGRELVLGGVSIEFERGLEGHSDADVLTHAIIDAVLGACGQGDIGRHFPDTDAQFKGISSLKLLEQVREMMLEKGLTLVNIDATVICERPRIGPYADAMKESLASVLGPRVPVNIKGKSSEHLGFTGRGEGICAIAIAGVQEATGPEYRQVKPA